MELGWFLALLFTFIIGAPDLTGKAFARVLKAFRNELSAREKELG